MRKKLICLLLLLALCLSLAGCGGVSYGVNPVITLVSQEYSMAFRNGDSLYYYVTAALEELSAEGAITELSRKWLGSNMVSFPKKAGALSAYQPPEPRIFIIGVDENSFPFAYGDNGNYWGFDVELATKLCQKLGWTLQVHVVEKENVRIELYSGNITAATRSTAPMCRTTSSSPRATARTSGTGCSSTDAKWPCPRRPKPWTRCRAPGRSPTASVRSRVSPAARPSASAISTPASAI